MPTTTTTTTRAATRPHPFRLYADPADRCVSCDGMGCRKFFDADCGWDFQHCQACLGRATAGLFRVRIHVGEIALDAAEPTDSFDLALADAVALAAQVGLRAALVARVSEVRVQYQPFDEHEGAEDVFAAAAHTPKAAPARA